MGKNDFRVDTAEQKSRKMLAKNQTLLGLALLLTVPQMFCAVFLPVRWVMDIRNGVSHNVAALASNELYFLVMAIAGAAVLKMMLSDKTFSKTLVWCVRLEGILLAIAAAIFPHLPGYLSLSREADPQHADGHGQKEPGAFQTKPSHCAKIHPGKADLLFFPGDGAAGQQSVHYSI